MSLINREDAVGILEAAKKGVLAVYPIMTAGSGIDLRSAMAATEAAYVSAIDLLKNMPYVEEQ